jgi:arylsulfatase
MHLPDAPREKNRGKSGQDDYSDRMVTHDEQIGQMLDKLDELGIADNTIVMYSTDNGPENDTWPDGANTPFRGQKDTNWEGGWRVPCFMRWPGKIKAGRAQRHLSPPGHAADAAGVAGDPGRQPEAARRLQGRRQDLQGAHRRLQLAAVPDRRDEGEPAQLDAST